MIGVARRRFAARRAIVDLAATLLLFGMVTTLAVAFALPWLPAAPPGGADIARYAPLRDGASRLEAKEDPSSQVVAWEGVNAVLLSSARASGVDVRKAPRDAIEKFLRRTGEGTLSEAALVGRLADVQVVEQHRRSLDSGGQVTTTVSLSLREARGEFLIGYYDPERDSDLLFDPPLQLLPSRSIGQAWGSEGRFGAARYTWRGRSSLIGPVETRLGRFDDCVALEALVHHDQQPDHGRIAVPRSTLLRVSGWSTPRS